MRTAPGTGVDPAALGFRPRDLVFIADPYPAYAELRAAGRIIHNPETEQWIIPHYEDVNGLLRDRRFGPTYLHLATHREMGRPGGPLSSAAAVEFSDYLRELIRERRQHPTEDLIGGLVQVIDQGDRLTEDEMIGTCVLLLNAGHEATVNMTGNGWWALYRNPDQLQRLRADHSLVPRAIEELMRYDTPLQMFERWVLEDVEIHGVPVPPGEGLALLFGWPTRPPAAFDRPDELDLGREPNPHMTFGAGIHFCLGAPLGRVELETSFGTLLRRAPHMELAAEPEWKPNYIIRGLRELRVRL